ncbi:MULTISPECIES: hypothetical protein [Mucilaginibacter]|nr:MULTISPECIES: hypothetical protein [Mucilaginibacter]NVM64139.1 hypothetical protein [Mucilaginibacter sp. SG538B]
MQSTIYLGFSTRGYHDFSFQLNRIPRKLEAYPIEPTGYATAKPAVVFFN